MLVLCEIFCTVCLFYLIEVKLFILTISFIPSHFLKIKAIQIQQVLDCFRFTRSTGSKPHISHKKLAEISGNGESGVENILNLNLTVDLDQRIRCQGLNISKVNLFSEFAVNSLPSKNLLQLPVMHICSFCNIFILVRSKVV